MIPPEIREQLKSGPIIEGIVTTLGASGEIHLAAQGPRVDVSGDWLLLRPYQSSTTFRNLAQAGHGVFHLVDDALLLVRAALGLWTEPPEVIATESGRTARLKECCSWREFEIVDVDSTGEPARLIGQVVKRGEGGSFAGFNRARHAVIEAAILATRVHLIPAAELKEQLERLRVPVEKTAGPRERLAFQLVLTEVERRLASR
jgi:uncharacterized protein